MSCANLIGWQAFDVDRPSEWKPQTLSHSQWPPDYHAVWLWRIATVQKLRDSPALLKSAKAFYSLHPKEFIMHWMDTYDPRRATDKWIPFVFFQRQDEFIDFLHELRETQQSGLDEKSRDMGASWLACAYSVWSWLFIESDSIGWGSRKQDLIDTLGDPDSLFEKMRLLINRLPPMFRPEGYTPSKHATFMKLLNPENGATITGEAGDNIGRGGRKSMYFLDEAAHVERPQKIEAALGNNTNVRVDISSVNGLGNVFHNRRENGLDWFPGHDHPTGFVRVFTMDWKDNPLKSQVWYDEQKAKYAREGMAHIFAQEVDRNYSAAIANTVIEYEWLEACVDAHLRIPYLQPYLRELPNIWNGGLDVADGGIDRNSLTLRQWIIWRHVSEWGERDVGVTARRAIMTCRELGLPEGSKIMYDCIGVGSGVKSEYNRLTKDENIQGIFPFVPWDAGRGVLNPFDRIIPDDEKSPMNKDFYHNLKAQAWWAMRGRVYKTWRAVQFGDVYDPEELISLDSSMPLLSKLMKELAQPTRGESGTLKALIEKKPDGTKSPNLADGGIQAFFPVPDDYNQIIVGNYG